VLGIDGAAVLPPQPTAPAPATPPKSGAPNR
jgi:hypothetical protein